MMPLYGELDMFDKKTEYVSNSYRNVQIHYVSYEYYSSLNLLPSHMHPFPTIMIVDKLVGTCEYRIGKSSLFVQPGDILLINPGVYHQKLLGVGSEIHEVHLAFEELQFEGLPSNHVVANGDFRIGKVCSGESQLYQLAVNALNCEADLEGRYGDLVACALFYQFLAVVLRSVSEELTPNEQETRMLAYCSGNHDTVVRSLREFLIENYTSNVTVSVVARRMYLSAEYLSRLFKAEVGKSPYTFLIELRINKAKELLENTSMPIHAIALRVGYSDAYHFSKQFKKATSMSPSEYRKTVNQAKEPDKEP